MKPFWFLFQCFAACIFIQNVNCQGGTPWATAEEEALDEVNDPQLFQAIVESIRDWENKHNRTRVKRSETSVCYPEVGCFKDGGYLDMVPSRPMEVGTRFLVYSSRHSRRSETPLLDVPFVNMSTAFEWAAKAFNMSIPTKVIVHGFGSSCSNVWVYEMRSALMSVEDCNVLCVDWESGAIFPNYVRAAANTRLVGRQLSLLLGSMKERLGLNLTTVHLIGFSLGAHVAAFAGAELGSVHRITGLDPAGPLFESQDPKDRLDSTDAEFVDVIHSNGETLILGGLGSWQPMGHVDFYPNGGRMQKGCTNLFVGAFSDIIWSGAALEARSLCNHRRAYKFFTDSVSPRCLFPSIPCHSYDAFLNGECFPCKSKSCPNMGYYADDTKARGTLYLITRDEEPFCAHQYLVRVESSPSETPVVSYGKIQLTIVADAQINETFTLTQKEDEELLVGSSLSKIIVPHPALQEFTHVGLLYTAYSGWISSGLAKWSIDNLSLMDSFGNKLSICHKGLVLESGIEIVLPLVPGSCGDNITDVSVGNSSLNSVRRNSTSYKPTEVVYIGDEILEANLTDRVYDLIDLETVNNRLESHDYGRSLKENKTEVTTEKITTTTENSTEIKEPILGPTTPKFKEVDPIDLSPPPMGATESWLHWEVSHKRSKKMDFDRSANESTLRSLTIQLFPQRLISFLEQAEKYARAAFSPSPDRVPRKLTLFWSPKKDASQSPIVVKKFVPLEDGSFKPIVEVEKLGERPRSLLDSPVLVQTDDDEEEN